MLLEFRLPRLGKGNHSSTILRWLVQPGDQVTNGQPMLEIETEKTRAEIPAPAAGTVTEIHVQAGTLVRVYEVLMVLEAQAKPQSVPYEGREDAGV